MARKSYVSSRRGQRAAKKKKSISRIVRISLEEAKARLRSSEDKVRDSEIDYSDIPPLNDDQLSKMHKVQRGRPLLGKEKRKLISIKVDPDLIETIKDEAQKLGKKYQSLIHEILDKHFYKKKRAA